jgi:hypothetical protein
MPSPSREGDGITSSTKSNSLSRKTIESDIFTYRLKVKFETSSGSTGLNPYKIRTMTNQIINTTASDFSHEIA